ncbi:MAG: ATP-binding protein [Steroidobacteraceae bacterium]
MAEVAASIVHEINQPLAAMMTSAESCLLWLGNEPPDVERARKAAERILRAGNHAGDIIASIRMLARKSLPQLVPVDVNGIIVEVIDWMRGELDALGIVPELDLQDPLQVVMGDRTQLQQVLMNLIRNAIESMYDASMLPRLLELKSCIDADGVVLIAVSDSGSGLDPAVAGRMFEPFFTTKSAGTGLGLSICRSIVEAHGGQLWAVPRLPRGSTFQFTLAGSRASGVVGRVSGAYYANP